MKTERMSERRRLEMARRIRESREDLALTQGELALRCGIYGGTLSRYESGERIPSPPYMRRLAEALGKTVPYLRASELNDDDNGGGIDGEG
jgi:transcriptional regulator with XRE-family HTH domain